EVRDAQGEPVCIRVGVHSGPVVGGVLGAKTPRFSIYGDTVNVASRMESHGLPGKIHISGAAYNRIVDKHKYAVRERGNITVKGRGNMTTYLIGGTHDDWLLHRNSFDIQLDGAYRDRGSSASSTASSSAGALGGRDGSFVITASAKSMENLNSNRSQLAMEAITEGDEDGRASRTLGNAAATARSSSAHSGALMTTSNASPYESATLAGLAPTGGAPPNLPGGGGGGGGSATFMLVGGAGSSAEAGYGGGGTAAAPPSVSVRSAVSTSMPSADMFARLPGTAGEAALRSAADDLAPLPPLPPPPPPPVVPVGAGPSLAGGGGGSFRERDGQAFRETSFRDTSFRAVYARGGRGPSSPLVSGSRAHLNLNAGGGSGGAPTATSHGAAAAADDALSGGGGSGRNVLLHSTSNATLAALMQGAIEAGGSGSGVASPLARGLGVEGSAGSGYGSGPSGGIVMARSKLTLPSPMLGGGGGAAATAAATAAAARASFGPAAAAAPQREPFARESGDAGVRPASNPKPLAPVQAAILQQLQAASLEESARARRASASSLPPSATHALPSSDSIHSLHSSSLMGPASGSGDGTGGAAPASTGKVKGLASKLKGLFKK
ncbi:Guanylate cyclase soluble subunit beta-2, partial [Tetrabaena socialis]